MLTVLTQNPSFLNGKWSCAGADERSLEPRNDASRRVFINSGRRCHPGLSRFFDKLGSERLSESSCSKYGMVFIWSSLSATRGLQPSSS
jgi:hypothetical protein